MAASVSPSALAARPSPRQAREPIDMPAETRALLQAGKLEQMCPDCGRWSAADHYCSNCFRDMSPVDWYKNAVAAERAARMPRTAPINPPSEYRHSAASWPEAWGPFPGEQRPKRTL